MTATAHALPVDRIDAQAKAQVDQYVRDRETGQTTSREIKEVIESIISTDYDGRTVIELLQNAHDAQPIEGPGGGAGATADEHLVVRPQSIAPSARSFAMIASAAVSTSVVAALMRRSGFSGGS